MQVPVLPESSPFTSEQRHWLNGFLAGITNTILNGAGSSSAFTSPPSAPTITVPGPIPSPPK